MLQLLAKLSLQFNQRLKLFRNLVLSNTRRSSWVRSPHRRRWDFPFSSPTIYTRLHPHSAWISLESGLRQRETFFFFFFVRLEIGGDVRGWESEIEIFQCESTFRPEFDDLECMSGTWDSSVLIEFCCAGWFTASEWLQVTADAVSPQLRIFPPKQLTSANFISESTPSGSTHDNFSDTCRHRGFRHQLDLIKFFVLHRTEHEPGSHLFTPSRDHDSITLTSRLSYPPEFFTHSAES